MEAVPVDGSAHNQHYSDCNLNKTNARPPILRDLGGEDSALRGGNRGQPFKLIAPDRTVIVSDRPKFKWDSVSGATAYIVFVNDPIGQVVAKSDVLAPDRPEWLVPTPLKRGEIYVWTVTAVVDGKERVSPGPSASEMKFQVLSSVHLLQLNQLRKKRSHLALGVFYMDVGMLDEAQLEFQTLSRLNPNSKAVGTLRSKVRSLYRHQ